jgi:hypothetical protein
MKLTTLVILLGLLSFVQASVYIQNPNQITLASKDCSTFGKFLLGHRYCHECRDYIFNKTKLNNYYKDCINYWALLNNYRNPLDYNKFFDRDVKYKNANTTKVIVAPRAAYRTPHENFYI